MVLVWHKARAIYGRVIFFSGRVNGIVPWVIPSNPTLSSYHVLQRYFTPPANESLVVHIMPESSPLTTRATTGRV
jgi:hypothetical protein